jgi:hypothetical protein
MNGCVPSHLLKPTLILLAVDAVPGTGKSPDCGLALTRRAR